MTNINNKSQKIAATIETWGNDTVLKMLDGSLMTCGFIVKHRDQLHAKDSQIVRTIVHAGYRIGADLLSL